MVFLHIREKRIQFCFYSLVSHWVSTIGIAITEECITPISSTNISCCKTRGRWQFCLSSGQHTGALCTQHSPTAAARYSQLAFPELWRRTAQSWTSLITRLSVTVLWQCKYDLRVVNIEEINQRLVEVWQSSNAAFKWKGDFRVSLFLYVVQKQKMKINQFLVTWFLRNTFVKNY